MRISDWSSDVCSSDLRQEKGEASEDERPRPCDRLIEQWQVAILALADEPHFLLGHMAADQEGNQRRNKGDREDEGGNERQHDGDRHRREGLAFDAGEHEQGRSEEHTSELQSLMRSSYAVFCLKK